MVDCGWISGDSIIEFMAPCPDCESIVRWFKDSELEAIPYCQNCWS